MGFVNTIRGLSRFFTPPLLAKPDGWHTDTTDIGAVERTAGGASIATLGVFNVVALTMYWLPFISPNRAKTVTQLAFEVTTAGALGSLGRIYLANNTNEEAVLSYVDRLSPCRLLADSGNIAVDTTGLKTTAISVELKPGRIYWIGVHADAVCTLRARSGVHGLPLGAPVTSGNAGHYLTRASVALGSFTSFVPSMTAWVLSGASTPHLRYTLT